MSDYSSIAYLLEKHAPPPRPHLPLAREIRIASAKQVLNKRNGRGWTIPLYAVKLIKKVYDELGTIEATGRALGIHGSQVSKLFRRNGMALRPAPVHPTIMHKGVKYRFDGTRYYTKCGRGNGGILLHRILWEERNGPIPDGHKLAFVTSNYHDLSSGNFRLMTLAEHHAFVINCRYRPRRAA
jgi:hypothetical protein